MPAIPPDTTNLSGEDRRRHPRYALKRRCKIFDPRSGKYHAASTIDLSNGGVLLSSRLPLHVSAGDHILLGIAMDERPAVLRGKDMIESTVIRKLESEDGATALAVQFEATGVSLTADLRHAA